MIDNATSLHRVLNLNTKDNFYSAVTMALRLSFAMHESLMQLLFGDITAHQFRVDIRVSVLSELNK